MSSGVGGGYAPGRTLASLSPEASMEASPRTGCGRAIGLVEAEGSPSRIILGIITGGRSPKVAATVVSPVLEAGIPTSTTGEIKDDKGRLASGRTAATLDDTEGGLTVMTKPEFLVADGAVRVEDKGTSLKGSTTSWGWTTSMEADGLTPTSTVKGDVQLMVEAGTGSGPTSKPD